MFESTSDNYYVNCDKMQITQVLTNIAKNSAESITSKYGKKKGLGIIQFTVKECDNDEVEISVKDNGGGVDEDLLLKISEPYVSTKKSGMGLGLSIVKKILEDHGSSLNFVNTTNGTEVMFKLKK